MSKPHRSIVRRIGAVALAFTSGMSLAVAVSFNGASPVSAFPLWPKGKEEEPQMDAPNKDAPKPDVPKKDAPKKDVPKKTSAKKNVSVDEEAAKNAPPSKHSASEREVVLPVPVHFVPSLKVNTNGGNGSGGGGVGGGGGSTDQQNADHHAITVLTSSHDPMTVYRKAGISPVEERKIRQLAAEYEGMQRVRLKLLDNLLAQMRDFQFDTEPDEKTVLAKQDEINKLSNLMANERVKLLLAIRDVMSHDEKIRLVDELERDAGMTPRNHGGEAPEIKPNQSPIEPD